MQKAYILIVDDEKRMCHLLSIMLEREGFKTDTAVNGKQALEMIREKPYDLVISDIKMPELGGRELLGKIKKENLLCPVIFITAFATVESSVDAMKAGAVDYITKPFEEAKILLSVHRALNLSRVMAENKLLKEKIQEISKNNKFVYKSEEMKQIMDISMKVAKTSSAVMITGESGTGKELLAKFIHHHSTRSEKRFVPVNCAAISPTLVESELFGYEKGAFTGADKRKKGKFEFASQGTLFLDEIGDMPLEAQAKLLRALEEQKFQRVGGNKEICVDVRVICATNKNLQEMVNKKIFRKDLLFRINVFPIHFPRLCKRIDDIIPLAKYFLTPHNQGAEIKISSGAERILKNYSWSGNVRELKNVMERALILTGSLDVITSESLSFLNMTPLTPESEETFRLPPNGLSLEKLQLDLVGQALEYSGYNKTMAAKLLGLTRAKFRVLARNMDKEQ
jgi:DNA-binding NtrC family response regulator